MDYKHQEYIAGPVFRIRIMGDLWIRIRIMGDLWIRIRMEDADLDPGDKKQTEVLFNKLLGNWKGKSKVYW